MQLEETCYWLVVSTLDAPTSIRVAPPLLPKLPSCHSYTELKALLLDTYGQSDDQWARIFLGMTDLGDRLPSEVMDEMLCLHGPEELNFVLRFAFKWLLPQPIRHALSTVPSSDLRAWAQEADRLMADHDDSAPMVAAMRKQSPARQQSPPSLLAHTEEEKSPLVAAANRPPGSADA